MLRLFVKKGAKQANKTCVQLCNLYSTKNFSKKESSKVQQNVSMKLESEHPVDRVMKCLKRDAAVIKRNLFFWKNFKSPADKDTESNIDYNSPDGPIFSNHCDIVIIGGGAIGSAVAYWCKMMQFNSCKVIVVEKDPTYKQASTVLSVGGLRQQFSLEENIEMSLFGAEFIRKANEYLGIEGESPIDLQFHPYGYLSLATEQTAEILKKNSDLQNSLGAKNVLLGKNQLKAKFPWLTVDDIELGCLGLEKEGWFDPWLLLSALKRKNISLGVEYVTAEAKGFCIEKTNEVLARGVEPGECEQIEYLVVETEDGQLRPINFSKCVIAAGAFSAEIAQKAKIGNGKGILSVPLPVEPRKRYVYCFHAPDGPQLNTPMTIDPTGTYFRREGLNNNYICGRCPDPDKEPSTDNLDVDPEFFNDHIWPVLANRVKAFENLKVKSSWAGYYEYNTFDENGIIGIHPYHDNLIIATGFSGHGIQQAPAVGRAVSELVYKTCFETIDLTRLAFERFITLEPMREKNIW